MLWDRDFVSGLTNCEMTQIGYPEILPKSRQSFTPSLSPNFFFSITIYLVHDNLSEVCGKGSPGRNNSTCWCLIVPAWDFAFRLTTPCDDSVLDLRVIWTLAEIQLCGPCPFVHSQGLSHSLHLLFNSSFLPYF